MAEHNYEFFRTHYGVPARRNAPVRYRGRSGKVTGTRTPHLKIKFDDEKRGNGKVFHPTWEMEWMEKPVAQIGENEL